METIIVFVISLIVGVYFLRLAFLNFSKEKYPTSTLFGLVGAFFILCSFPWFQGFAKTWIVSNVNSKLKALGDQIDDVQKTTGEMHGELSKHQKQIDEHQEELDTVQGKIRKTQSEVADSQIDITNQYFRLSSIQQDIGIAQTNLDAQQKKIEDVEFLVNNLYSKTESETISGNDTNRVFLLKDWGDVKRFGFLLKHAAIPKSIHGIMSGGSLMGQTPLLAITANHVNFFVTSFTGIDVKNTTFEFQYVRDTRETNSVRSFLTVSTNLIILDDGVTPAS